MTVSAGSWIEKQNMKSDQRYRAFDIEEDNWKADVFVEIFNEELYTARLAVNSTVYDGIFHRGELLGGDQRSFRNIPYSEDIVLDWADSAIDRILEKADKLRDNY